MVRYIFILSLALFLGCDKDETNNQDQANEMLTKSEWVVSLFSERAKDETHHFIGYVFQFNADKSFLATTSNNTFEGSWNERNDDTTHELDIQITGNEYLDEISDDWDIISMSSSKIELKEVSGGDGHIELLTFVKK